MTAPGWYPDPSGMPHQRYHDGIQWTSHTTAVQAPPAGVVVTGPNHVLHLLLTVFTWPLCGGWAWVWLFIALSNKRTVHVVSANGPRHFY
ncbi:hypothetical protein PBI_MALAGASYROSE_40 [Mycobacterium phage MalagasyRose]|uniref:DUF2510 domain-containing protein n=1 Tax=Mycobacterium phage MalagasyRose TaxID=2599870 RepID=A0A5J6TDN9_9CAUD|nr:hypothetical protein QEH39_gp48 [Mycobacterium phage MalagasyRose]QFG08936.1 hypothetical protein PBI_MALAGASYROSE_40 [Mycobacterium phage MalagasyRose]